MIFCLLLLLVTSGSQVKGQALRQLSLEEARRKARDFYPLGRQRGLLDQTEHLTLANLNKRLWPQLALGGQATYQSEVTQIPVRDFPIQPLSKDQYQVVAQLSQVLYDGGTTRARKALQQLETKIEVQKLEVELHQLDERIDRLFLGIILLEKQAQQAALIQKDLQAGLEKTRAQVRHGVAFRSGLQVLEAESLRASQQEVALQTSRQGLIQTLGLYLNEALDSTTLFLMPAPPPPAGEIRRPELQLFQEQSGLLAGRKSLLASRSRPQLSFFGQSGYGRPGLNFLRNEFGFFSLAGLRLSWGLGDLYTLKNEKRLIALSDQALGYRREAFLLHTRAELVQQQAEIDKLHKLMAADQEIIRRREQVKRASQAQLAGSVITAHDYIREVIAEDQARQQLILHQLQLLQAQLLYQTLVGY